MYVTPAAPSIPVHRRRTVEGPRPRMHAEVRAGTMHDRPRTEARTRTMTETRTRTRTETRTRTMTETRTGGGTKTWARTTKARAARTRSHARTSMGPRERSPRKRSTNNARNHQFFGHFLHFPSPLLVVSVGDSPPVMLGTVPSLQSARSNRTGKLTRYLQNISRQSTSWKCVEPAVPSARAWRKAENGAFFAVGVKSSSGA